MPTKPQRRFNDPTWHLQLGVMVIVGLQFLTSPAFLPYSKYLMIFLELLLVALLIWITPDNYHRVSRNRRVLAITLIGVIAVSNVLSLFLLLGALLSHDGVSSGRQLLVNAVVIYITNIFMFSLLYWEMDGGGPDRRVVGSRREDFLFTQMANPRFAEEHWKPGFTDYLYLSATNVTNFASADVVPLTHRAKLLMMSQSLVSVMVVVLVAARAVSILQ
jgi:uncharacterized membrane protein